MSWSKYLSSKETKETIMNRDKIFKLVIKGFIICPDEKKNF
ncbi:hypothetical protein [Clostridioides sp. ZZV14-6045]